MKIGILSRKPINDSTRRLREAAQARGHHLRVFNTLGFSLHVEEEEPSLYDKNKPMPRLDAVLNDLVPVRKKKKKSKKKKTV